MNDFFALFSMVLGSSLLAVALCLLVLNTLLGCLYRIKNASSGYFVKQIRSNPDYLKAYPGMTPAEIAVLLTETWSRPLAFDSFTHFSESRPFKGTYVNVTPAGFRPVKDQGVWPPDNDTINVLFIGGSTTFGYGVPDDRTIPSYFQELASEKGERNVRVYNFGKAFYFSSQERIFVQKLLLEGVRPDLVVLIDGMNDFHHVTGEPTDVRAVRSFFQGTLGWHKLLLEVRAIRSWPLVRFLKPKLAAAFASGGDAPRPGRGASGDDGSPDKLVDGAIDRYIGNLKIMDALAREFGFRNCFVFQPSPYYRTGPRSNLFVKPYIGDFANLHEYQRIGYARITRKVEQIKDRFDFLWLADMQEGLDRNLYCDSFHYTADFNKLIAARILDHCLAKGSLTKR